MIDDALVCNCDLRSVCFDVKYLQENIFIFYGVCFVVKHLFNGKIFSVKQYN